MEIVIMLFVLVTIVGGVGLLIRGNPRDFERQDRAWLQRWERDVLETMTWLERDHDVALARLRVIGLRALTLTFEDAHLSLELRFAASKFHRGDDPSAVLMIRVAGDHGVGCQLIPVWRPYNDPRFKRPDVVAGDGRGYWVEGELTELAKRLLDDDRAKVSHVTGKEVRAHLQMEPFESKRVCEDAMSFVALIRDRQLGAR